MAADHRSGREHEDERRSTMAASPRSRDRLVIRGRRRVLVTALVVVTGALVAGATMLASRFGRIGPQPDGTGITPNHWMLTLAGRQVEIGDRPLGMAMTPDGR